MAVATCAGTAATLVAAAPNSAAVKDGPRPLVSSVKYVKSGTPTWVKAYWKTRRDVCDAKVTVSRVIRLKVRISYTQLPRGTFGPGVDPEAVPCTGRELTRVTTIKPAVIGERDL